MRKTLLSTAMVIVLVVGCSKAEIGPECIDCEVIIDDSSSNRTRNLYEVKKFHELEEERSESKDANVYTIPEETDEDTDIHTSKTKPLKTSNSQKPPALSSTPSKLPTSSSVTTTRPPSSSSQSTSTPSRPAAGRR